MPVQTNKAVTSKVYVHTLSGAVEALTSSPNGYEGRYITVINDDGANANSVIYIGVDSAECLIPIQSGGVFTLRTSNTNTVYVNGTAGDKITIIIASGE